MRLKDHVARLVALLDETPFIESRQINIDDRPPDALFIKGKVLFTNGSRLVFKEFAVQTTDDVEILKYGYHFEDKKGYLIIRYDNAHDPAARQLATWPHHRHTQSGIEAAERPAIEDLMDEIVAHITIIAVRT